MTSLQGSSTPKPLNIDLVIVQDESCSVEFTLKKDAFLGRLKNNFTIQTEYSNDQTLVFYLLTANSEVLRSEAEYIGLQVPGKLRTPVKGNSRSRNVEKQDLNSAYRSQLVWSILQRTSFRQAELDPISSSSELSKKFRGIERLLDDGVFLAAYPLHEKKNTSALRTKLSRNWGAFSWTTPQPIVDIKEYFGEQMALYFAWLGFYTYMLFPLSILGTIVFLINLLNYRRDPRVEDVCRLRRNVILCPPCDNHCQYTRLDEWCKHAILSSLSDNWLTVPFSCFVLLWALVFRVAWKRYVSRMALCINFIDEKHQRTQHQDRILLVRTWLQLPKSFEMIKRENFVSFLKRLLIYGFVFAMGLAVLYVSVKILNLAVPLRAAVKKNIEHDTLTPLMGLIITSGISVCVIWVLNNIIFYYIAKWLTNLENPETRADFDHWLTLKLYIVQFVSYYFSVGYVALFQGRFLNRPNQETYVEIPPDQCGPLGCFPELFVQMMCIMFLKPIFNNFFEYIVPSLKRFLNIFCARTQYKRKTPYTRFGPRPQWEKEFVLQEQFTPGLFYEYVEMIMQYGYVVMFAGAFPLAPLFAMLNNLFEMRLDGHKFLKKIRRPIAEPTDDIGAWFLIIGYLTKIAILVNGLLLAFGSDIVPRIYYFAVYNRGLSGYVDFSLAYFDTMTYKANATHYRLDLRERFCRFPKFRNSPFSIGNGISFSPDSESEQYWILFFRVVFLFAFENFAALMDWGVELYSPKLTDISKRFRGNDRSTNLSSSDSEAQVDTTFL